MYKSIIAIFFAMMFVLGCSKDNSKEVQTEENKNYTLEQISNESFEYKSGDVTVEGLCIHVCAHSGKKMFIIGKDEKTKMQIFTSDKLPSFDKKLEGSKVQVTGTLEEEKIDDKYVAEMEKELAAENTDSKGTCPTEEDMLKINELKDKIANSKKGYVSIYTMVASKVKQI